MPAVNFRSFVGKLAKRRKTYRSFLTKTEKKEPAGINKLTPKIEAEVWQEVECLSCANCCKKMTPTFTENEVVRIAKHFKQTPEAFKKQWLKRQDKDWVNKNQPCQFLDLKTNMCSIYAIRPADCAGFPHLSKNPWHEYAHVHKQNIDYCPATFAMVEKIIAHYEA